MHFFKSMLVFIAFLGASLSSATFAVDLYEDVKKTNNYRINILQ